MFDHDRRVDVTLGIHLEGTDTRSSTDDIVKELRERLEQIVVHVPRARGYVKVMSTDDPVYVHNAQQGKRV